MSIFKRSKTQRAHTAIWHHSIPNQLGCMWFFFCYFYDILENIFSVVPGDAAHGNNSNDINDANANDANVTTVSGKTVDYETLEATEELLNSSEFLNNLNNDNNDQEVDEDDDDDDDLLIDGSSEILTKQEIKNLSFSLPDRLMCCTWRKSFFSSRDGFSLRTLYRKQEDHTSRPAVLVTLPIQKKLFLWNDSLVI